MAEEINTGFEGVPIAELEPDGEILEDSYAEIVGDLAFVRDIALGEDATNYLRHDGQGRGARIGNPWVNQMWRKNKASAGGYEFQDDKPGYYLGMWACRAPYGETQAQIRAIVQSGKKPGIAAVVLNSSFVEQSRTALEYVPSSGALKGSVTLTENALNIVCLETISDGQSNPETFQIFSVSITPGRIAGRFAPVAGDLTYRTDSDDGAKPMSLLTQTASSATVMDPVVVDDSRIGNGRTIDAMAIAELAATQNGLREFLCGLPAGHNLSHTLADSGSRGAFYRASGELSGANYVAGRRAAMPVYCESLGNVKNDATVTAGTGVAVDTLYTYPCPAIEASGTISQTTLSRPTIYIPNVPSDPTGGGDDALDGVIIVAQGAIDESTVTLTGRIATSVGSSSTGISLGGGSGWHLISITGIPFTPGAGQYLDMSIAATTTSKGSGTIKIVGWAVWLNQQ